MSPAVDPAALPKTSRVAREQSRRLRKILVCPGCTAHLIAERKEGVEIDRCELCEGIWLDAGEYDAVRHSIEISRGRPPEMNKATADSRDAPIAIALEVIGALLELIPQLLGSLGMRVRGYRDSDWGEWLRMSAALFPHYAAENLAAGMREHRMRSDADVFIAEREDGSIAGFVEVGAREYADGCETAPVGYIEAWYVDTDVRQQGYGRALLEAAESWARSRGYREMASDAQIDNDVSLAAHRNSGYEVVDRVVQLRKDLTR